LNLLARKRIGQFKDADFSAILPRLGELIAQSEHDPSKVANALGQLVELFEGKHPASFVAPADTLPDPYILDRSVGGLDPLVHGDSVRDAIRES
jgi:hypothetical protein